MIEALKEDNKSLKLEQKNRIKQVKEFNKSRKKLKRYSKL